MELLENIVLNWMWGLPLIIVMLATGLVLTVASGFFQFRYFGHAMRKTMEKLFRPPRDELPVPGSKDRSLSPFEALSVAVGSTVGVGNIAAVASAIALGGPGAVFWMWIAGFLGQIIKMAEVSLAVHYRSSDPDGITYGGPTYYIKKGIGEKRKLTGLYKTLNALFLGGFVLSFLLTMQNYTVSEAIAGAFEDVNGAMKLDIVDVSIIYTILTYGMIIGGLKWLSRIAVKLVPFMCVFFLLGGLFIIFKNIGQLPHALGLIFSGAFSGTAAVGGFAGAGIAHAIKIGMARAVYSNEAGWGTSPMIHASAKTDHPVRQGLMGVFEVFIDTIVVCTITALVVIITGEWTSGKAGATLTLSAFRSELGEIGRYILVAGIFLFGITTSSGFYAQIEVLVRYMVGQSRKKNIILWTYKVLYPIPAMLLVIFATKLNMDTKYVWLFADMGTAIPIFINIVALAFLLPDFRALLLDYKKRHMNIL